MTHESVFHEVAGLLQEGPDEAITSPFITHQETYSCTYGPIGIEDQAQADTADGGCCLRWRVWWRGLVAR